MDGRVFNTYKVYRWIIRAHKQCNIFIQLYEYGCEINKKTIDIQNKRKPNRFVYASLGYHNNHTTDNWYRDIENMEGREWLVRNLVVHPVTRRPNRKHPYNKVSSTLDHEPSSLCFGCLSGCGLKTIRWSIQYHNSVEMPPYRFELTFQAVHIKTSHRWAHISCPEAAHQRGEGGAQHIEVRTVDALKSAKTPKTVHKSFDKTFDRFVQIADEIRKHEMLFESIQRDSRDESGRYERSHRVSCVCLSIKYRQWIRH